MFIKTIPKTDRSTGKTYNYYRLCESYRLGTQVRHRTILSLGTLVELTEKQDFKLLADRIEQLVKGLSDLFVGQNPVVERLAVQFYSEIVNKNLIDHVQTDPPVKNFQAIDVESIELENAREIGSEWMCYQALQQLSMSHCLEQAGIAAEDIPLSLAHIISRAVFPASEHATSEWIKENSAVCELFSIDPMAVSHHKLYRISQNLSKQKEKIESFLSRKTNELFDLQDKIILYDLTNTYFEGRKLKSSLAMFGNSKEKRSDARLVTLALVVNVEGFVKHSQIYRGNIGEPTTLSDIIGHLSTSTSSTDRKPLVVIDAGIASDDNLAMLRNERYDYLCVSRSTMKDYKAVKQDSRKVIITDKRKSPIELMLIEKEGISDTLLYIRSERKAGKEMSMNQHFTSHFEQGLAQVQQGIQKKGGTKKLIKVWERIGRLKEKYPSAHRFYQLEVSSIDSLATGLTWKKIIPATRKEEGVYLLRTTIKNIDEKNFWMIYNTIREIESSFRTLKTDLQLRPVFHKTDENVMAHLELAIFAYQMVNTIRHQLKAKGIHHDWSHLVRIMSSQKAATVTMINKDGRKLYIRKCTNPEPKVREVYDALGYKYYPFIKKSVLPENENIKPETPENREISDG